MLTPALQAHRNRNADAKRSEPTAAAADLPAIQRAAARITSAQAQSTEAEAALVRGIEQAVGASPPGLGRPRCRTTLIAALVLMTLLGAAGGGCFWLGRRTAAIEDAQLAPLLRDKTSTDATASEKVK